MPRFRIWYNFRACYSNLKSNLRCLWPCGVTNLWCSCDSGVLQAPQSCDFPVLQAPQSFDFPVLQAPQSRFDLFPKLQALATTYHKRNNLVKKTCPIVIIAVQLHFLFYVWNYFLTQKKDSDRIRGVTSNAESNLNFEFPLKFYKIRNYPRIPLKKTKRSYLMKNKEVKNLDRLSL